MFLSRVSLAPHADVQQVARQACRDAYREHQFLWRLFESDPDAERDFLFRRDSVLQRPRFYLLSQRRPMPIDGLWLTESKPFEPRLKVGQRLAFSLRANAVVTRRDGKGRQVRHDVVMDLWRKRGDVAAPSAARPSLSSLAGEAGEAWLQQRAGKHGFSLIPGSLSVEAYQQHRIHKKGGKQPIRYSTLDFSGLLTVEDVEHFWQALMQGIGPAKAFGCGLLLVRPVY